jgi:putative alpha-1,2-mannosidase
VTSGNLCGYIDKRRSWYTVYFVAEFDQPFLQTGAWHDAQVTPGATKAEGGSGFGEKGFPDKGHGSGVWVGFDPVRTRQVLVRVGISYVSEANARENLKAENPRGTAFEALRQRAERTWNQELGQIEIEGGTDDQRTVFTTALYHASMTPNVASDSNGEYRGMDGKVHRIAAPQHAQHANFSGWDVYPLAVAASHMA